MEDTVNRADSFI